MPYIKKNRRGEMLFEIAPDNAGELNYAITSLLNMYLLRKGINYQHINDCIGALEGAKLELYRRVAVPYENVKLSDNGDVYGNTE